MKVGLFFGSFNPVHVGHLIIAQTMLNESDCDQVWLVVSPQNPLKDKATLAPETDRYTMCELATQNHDQIFPSNYEFFLPKPSYTIDTLTHLTDQFPTYRFAVLMGSDNLNTIHKWKNYEALLKYYPIYVYPRPNSEIKSLPSPLTQVISAPMLDISATRVREMIQSGKSVRYLLPEPVVEYLTANNLYAL